MTGEFETRDHRPASIKQEWRQHAQKRIHPHLLGPDGALGLECAGVGAGRLPLQADQDHHPVRTRKLRSDCAQDRRTPGPGAWPAGGGGVQAWRTGHHRLAGRGSFEERRHTLLLGTNSTHAASVYLFKNPGYDPVKNFTPICQFTVNPQLLVVNADLPVHSLKDFIRYAKSRAKQMNFGAGNTGSLVAAEMLKRQGGFDATAVNYQGNAQAIQDFVSGRLDFMVTDPLIVKPFLGGGKIRILGITSRQRLPNFPDVVPLAEAGLPDFDYSSWVGLFAPAGLDAGIAETLHRECARALGQPDVVQFLTGLGMIPASRSRQEFAAFVTDQIHAWGQWTRDAGLTAN